MNAADLLKSSCPLHGSFVAWCKAKNTEPTKRQATKFLRTFPQFTQAKAA